MAKKTKLSFDQLCHLAVIVGFIDGTASELLHRELVYSGFLPEGASYSSKLLACLEVAP